MSTKTKTPRWRLRVRYWAEDRPSGYGISVGVKDGNGRIQRETFAAGPTKAKTLENWFFQYYKGEPPRKPRIPKDALVVEWNRWHESLYHPRHIKC
jgi:hypothetical protein